MEVARWWRRSLRACDEITTIRKGTKLPMFSPNPEKKSHCWSKSCPFRDDLQSYQSLLLIDSLRHSWSMSTIIYLSSKVTISKHKNAVVGYNTQEPPKGTQYWNKATKVVRWEKMEACYSDVYVECYEKSMSSMSACSSVIKRCREKLWKYSGECPVLTIIS